MQMRVTDKDNGYNAMRERLKGAGVGGAGGGKGTIAVGVFGSEAEQQEAGSDLTLADIAAIHEFGAPDAGIPERSFIRGFVDEKRDEINTVIKKLAQRVASEETMERALNQLGLWLVGQIQKRISDGITPNLADSTIKGKGSSTPLVDTGQLRSSITYRIERGE